MKSLCIALLSLIIFSGCNVTESYLISVSPSAYTNSTEVTGITTTGSVFTADQTINSILPNVDEHYSFQWSDWNQDGFNDLIAINRAGSKSAVIYILDGSTGLKSFLLQQPINFPVTDAATDFAMTRWDEDVIPDLIIFHRNGTSNVEVQILGGAADAEHPAFFKTLTGFSLPFSDPDNHLLFFFGDYNMDNIDELEVINTVADSNMEVSYYSRQDMFAHLLESKRTAIPNAQGRYAFAFGEMNVKGLKDLFIIDHNDLTAPKIMVSYYLVSFSVNTPAVDLPVQHISGQSAFFTGPKLATSFNPVPPGADIVFNPNPMLTGTGPQDVAIFDGMWETNYTVHSNDNNGISGIVIDYQRDKTQKTLNGFKQQLNITFEDEYQVACTAENGNLEFKETSTGRLLPDAGIEVIDNQYLVLSIEGSKYTLKRYFENLAVSPVRITNEAGYASPVSAEWSYTGFGGKVLQGKMNEVTMDALFNRSTIITVPQNAYNFNIHVKVSGGLDYTFFGGADCTHFDIKANPDAGCYRIKGTTFSPGYDNECKADPAVTEAFQNPYVQAFVDYCTHKISNNEQEEIASALAQKDYSRIMEVLGNDLLKEMNKVTKQNNETGYVYNKNEQNFAAMDQSILEYFHSKGISKIDCLTASFTGDFGDITTPDTIVYDQSEEAPFSITVGFNGGGALGIVQGSVELGVVLPCCNISKDWDTYNYPDMRLFTTLGIGPALGLGAEAGISLGFSTGRPFSQDMQDEYAVNLNVEWGVGAGVAIMLSCDDHSFSGVSVSLDTGAEFEIGTEVMRTWFYNLDDLAPDYSSYPQGDYD